jgi:hypothetical protein
MADIEECPICCDAPDDIAVFTCCDYVMCVDCADRHIIERHEWGRWNDDEDVVFSEPIIHRNRIKCPKCRETRRVRHTLIKGETSVVAYFEQVANRGRFRDDLSELLAPSIRNPFIRRNSDDSGRSTTIAITIPGVRRRRRRRRQRAPSPDELGFEEEDVATPHSLDDIFGVPADLGIPVRQPSLGEYYSSDSDNQSSDDDRRSSSSDEI